jgi:hypothetical protein
MKSRRLLLSVTIGILGLGMVVTSCHKDIPPPPHKPPVVVDSCIDAFYNYSTPVSWPFLNWTCDSCVLGCEFNDNYKRYEYKSVGFNPSNPNQIVYNRFDNISRITDNFTFDFCTGKLVNFLPGYGTIPLWGSNNWIIFINGSGYVSIVRPMGIALPH